MIRFNANGKIAKFDSSNPFYANLPNVRQTLFKRAFGLLGSKAHYQADLMESRKFIQGVLETYASLTGATLSQVVHAVCSGNSARFAIILHRRIQDNLVVSFEKTDRGSVRHESLTLAAGHRWKGNISALDEVEIEKTCMELWSSAAGVLTEKEKALEGVEGAVNKLDAENRARSKAYQTPKKNVMEGVEVVNRRQKARQDAVAA